MSVAALGAAVLVLSFASRVGAQVSCATFTATNNDTTTATAVYDSAIVVAGVTFDLRATTIATTGGKFVTLACVGNIVRVQVRSAVGGTGTATIRWEALDAAGNAIVLQNFFFELVDLDGPNIEFAEFSTGASYCRDGTGTVAVSTMGSTVTVEGTVADPSDGLQLNGSGGTSFDVLYGVASGTSTNRWFDHGLMTGEPGDLLDTCVGCGDGTIAADEGCDDSNWIYGDGCSSGCLVEVGSACGTTGLTGDASCVAGAGCDMSGGAPGICGSLCTDGNLDAGEACDDGNTDDTDACSNACLVNLGFGTCSTNIDCVDAALGVACNAGVCELGLEEGPCDGVEDCETGLICDSNTSTCLIDDGDGTCVANSNCASGLCDTMSGLCEVITCGDGLIEGVEECDDGGALPGDGCDGSCNLETGCFNQAPSFAVSQTNVGVGNPDNALGAPQMTVAGSAQLRNGDSIDLFFDVAVPAGTTVTIFAATNNNSNGSMTISESTNGSVFGAPSTFNSFAANNTIEQVTYVTTSANVTHIRIVRNNRRIFIDAITFSEFINCDTCGDGAVDVGEECDDNNAVSDDGCSDNCIVDPGATCAGEPSVCSFPPLHTSIGWLRWNTDGDVRELAFDTRSEAGALVYQVGWADGGVWDTGTVMSSLRPSGATYVVDAPASMDPWSRPIRLDEVDASGETHLVFEGLVPEEGLSFAGRADIGTSAQVTRRRPKAAAVDGADSAAIYLPSSGVYEVELNNLATALGLTGAVLQSQIAAGEWGVTAEGVAVPSAFDESAGRLYIASRWRNHPTTASIPHLFQPVAIARSAAATVLHSERTPEPDGAHAGPLADDPLVPVVFPASEGNLVVPESNAAPFEGHARINFERDEFAALAAAPPSDEEFWFWAAITGTAANMGIFEHTFDTGVEGLSPNSDVHLRAYVAAGAGGAVDQLLRVELNGVAGGEVQLDSVGWVTLTFRNAGPLTAGDNTLRFEALAENNDGQPSRGFVFVDGFELEVNGSWVLLEREVSTGIFSASSAVEPANGARRVVPSPVAFDLQSNQFTIAAPGFAPIAAPGVRYTAGTGRGPALVRGFVSGSKDALLNERVEHLILAADGLGAVGERLSGWRAASGLSSRTVLLTEIFDRFGAGIADTAAIVSYLRAYQARWGEAPTYLVLLGAGSIDRSTDPMDAYATVPPAVVTVSDGIYASHTAFRDAVAGEELIVGQIPVRTPQEATTVVDKIVQFESLGADAWKDLPVVLAAGENRDVNFTRLIQQFDSVVGGDVERELFDANNMVASEATSMFTDHLRRGVSWLNYVGHGSFDQLGDGPIVARSDLPALADTLGESGAYTFFTSLSCTTSRSELPGFESFSEQLLKLSRGGAIGVWGPTGTWRPKHAVETSRALAEALGSIEDAGRLGDIVRAAQLRAVDLGVPPSDFDVFVLFADPATTVPPLRKRSGEDIGLPGSSESGSGCGIVAARQHPSEAWLIAAVALVLLRRPRFRVR